MPADRHAIGQPGYLEPEGAQQPGDIHGRRLALGIRVGGKDDLLYLIRGGALEKLADLDILRPDPRKGRYDAVEHMVKAMILAGALDGDKILGVGD